MQALIKALEEGKSYSIIKQSVLEGKLPLSISGLGRRVSPLLMYGFPCESNKQRLIVTYNEKRAREIVEDYKLYDRNVFYYPAKDLLFYQADIHSNTTVSNRLEIFRRLAEGEPTTVVTTIEGLMDKLPRLSHMTSNVIKLKVGDNLDIKELSGLFADLGYEKLSMVEEPGQFSVRGGIVDIYPLTEACPYRIDFFGDEIDSIRSFDVESQRSIDKEQEIEIYPSSEMVLSRDRIESGLKKISEEHKLQAAKLKREFRSEQYARLNRFVEDIYEELKEFNSAMGLDSLVGYFYDTTVSFVDYFSKDTNIFIDEPEQVARQATVYFQEFVMSMQGRLEGGYVLPTQADALFSDELTMSMLTSRKLILFQELYKKQSKWNEKLHIEMHSVSLVSYNGSFEALIKDITEWKKKSYKVAIVSPSETRAKRLAKELQNADIEAHYMSDNERALLSSEIVTAVGRLENGFIIDECNLVVVSESDFLASKEIRKKKKLAKYQGDKIRSYSDLSIGDYVIHENHGVGVYRGIEKIEVDGRQKDYIGIEYSGGSKLFVPVEQFDRIGKLSSKDGARVKLNKLGGEEWSKVKSRVKGHIDDIAEELVNLYAIRQSQKGFAYSADTEWQKEFEEMFPYDETLDQQKAINDSKRDMESDRIMDRLICGDVGFGKTEVAIRAAFKAVQEDRQVAYLVPTTILAEQHYNTFVERMKNYPVTVRMLSRFCSTKEIKETIQGMKKGEVDIVIGTHRLLSADIEFSNLGLLIIDEEQRFGVKHKEKIKQIKKNVDVLTLTATPIPRTLHMSLVGLRDISLLQEPPIDRLPIQTYIMEYDIEFVKEAINRELIRDGQVYYVYNNVNTITEITAQLRSVLPDAVIEFAHGKMNSREVEDIMHRFINKEIDVLVSTTIIETGLDIPNVNTIIIHDADKFGLSQLYQLRGRVGRSNRSAYAFLLYKRDKMLKEIAEKRLKAIKEFTELGSGYKISMKDLEIRGAGNLLGQEQSGNIEAIGYDLYCKMLNDAISKLTGKEIEQEFATSIELPVDAYIADSYVKNEFVKLELYKRIAKCQNREDTEEILDEVKDRFGEPSKALYRLLDIACLKSMAHKAFIQDIKYVDEELRFVMWQNAPVYTERMSTLLNRYKGKLRFRPDIFTFSIRASKLIQEELIQTAEDVVNNIEFLTADLDEKNLEVR